MFFLVGLMACAGATQPGNPGGPGTGIAPMITSQPTNQTVTAPAAATFLVTATGTAPLSYQWQKNGAAIAGAANSPSYTTPATAAGDNGAVFQVIVSNAAGNTPSGMATLTVNPGPAAPTITSQPTSVTVTAPATATFTVTATGTAPLSYQWQKGTTNIAGAPNSPSYTTPATSVAADNGTTFRVIVSNGTNPPATSNSATLTVNAAPVAPTITSQPTNQTVTAPATATFTVTAMGTAPLSYQWQKNSANIAGAPNSASYTTPATTVGDSGATFRVIVSNGMNPPATSNSATLTVNAAPSAPMITTQPSNQTVTAPATATFAVTATGTAPLSYQWQKGTTNIAGAPNSPSYTTPATSVAADNGTTFRVIVSNGINPPATSNAATLTVNATPPPSNITVLTYHNDSGRTGQNLSETTLTTSNVNSGQFGFLANIAVDGPVDAEPLYVGNLTINGAAHNVLFVATENDSVYAFDADSFAQLWKVSVLGASESPSDDRGCSQVEPTIGVTSTPVIDLNAGPNGTIFVVSMSKNGSTYHQRLHALDLVTHAELNGGPTEIQATFPNMGGTTTFNPAQYEERTGLLLSGGVIYLAWTSHCDGGSYTAWVMGYSEASLQQTSVIDLTPNGSEGGIWMAGDGLAADSSGNIYFLIGNGTFDTTLNGGLPSKGDYGNAFVKLSTNGGTLSVADYFTMHNTVSESNADTDLGSGGVMLLPDLKDSQNNTRQLAVGAGKDSNMYIVDRDNNNMGKFNPNNDNAIYQELAGALSGGVWSAPAYFNNTVYYGSVGSSLRAFPVSNAKLASSPSSSSPSAFGYPGTTPSISANGNANGIVWAIENGSSTGALHAFDASNLATELFSGTFSTNNHAKFVTPMIANGKVYVGAPTAVAVFGLLNQGTKLMRKPSPTGGHHRRFSAPATAPRPGSSTPGN